MNLVFLGYSGSGKSTVAKRVAEECGLSYISSGVIARQMAEDDPHTRMSLNSGLLAPEDAMRQAMKAAVREADPTIGKGGFVLDGFPRSVAQYVALVSWRPGPLTFIWLDVHKTEAIARLLERGRSDDNPDSIARKLADFDHDTMPVVEMTVGASYRVETTNLSPEQAFDTVMSALR